MEERRRELQYIPEHAPIPRQQKKSILKRWDFQDMTEQKGNDTGLRNHVRGTWELLAVRAGDEEKISQGKWKEVSYRLPQNIYYQPKG